MKSTFSKEHIVGAGWMAISCGNEVSDVPAGGGGGGGRRGREYESLDVVDGVRVDSKRSCDEGPRHSPARDGYALALRVCSCAKKNSVSAQDDADA